MLWEQHATENKKASSELRACHASAARIEAQKGATTNGALFRFPILGGGAARIRDAMVYESPKIEGRAEGRTTGAVGGAVTGAGGGAQRARKSRAKGAPKGV